MKPSLNLAVLALALAIGAMAAFATWPAHAATRGAGEPELRVHRDRAVSQGVPPAASSRLAAAFAAASPARDEVVPRNSGNTPSVDDFSAVFASLAWGDINDQPNANFWQ